MKINDLAATIPPECTLERVVATPRMTFQLRRYRWEAPTRAQSRSEDHAFLDFAVTPRPSYSKGRLGLHRWRAFGPMFMVPPNVDFQATVPGGRQQALNCLLPLEVLAECGMPAQLRPEALEACLDIGSPRPRAYMELILAEVRAPGFGSELALESLATALAVILGRELNKEHPGPATRGGLPAWRRRLIEERCRAEELPPPDLSELAKLADLTTRHLIRAFRQEYGTTPAAYVRQISIERAKRRLRRSDAPIKQIALDLGFASTASFCHAFRQATGVRPGDYQRQAPLSDV